MTLHGIDISNWQKGINVGGLPGDFVIVKATEGTAYVSPSYAAQIQAAHNAGKLSGVYHFMRTGAPTVEAAHFLKTVNGEIGKSILIIDVEDASILGGSVQSFAEYVQEQTGVWPWVYVNASMLNKGAYTPASVLKNCGIWLAGYPSTNQTTAWRDDRPPYHSPAGATIAAWQYTSHFRTTAWAGDLDASVFYGDRNAWAAYANPNGKAHAATAPITQPTAAVKKSVSEIAREVIAGKWGTGNDRKNRLTKAGYDYNAVQAEVNKQLRPASTRKSNDEIAKEVIAGKWGNGNDRKNRLTKAGYDYAAIQKIVNARLKK